MSRAARPLRLLLALAAASAVIVVAFRVFGRGTHDGSTERPPSSAEGQLSTLAPVGAVESFATFRWSGGRPAKGSFQVAVYDADDSSPFKSSVASSGPLEGPVWTPTPDELAAMPPRIEWEVVARDSRGDFVRSAAGVAERTGP